MKKDKQHGRGPIRKGKGFEEERDAIFAEITPEPDNPPPKKFYGKRTPAKKAFSSVGYRYK